MTTQNQHLRLTAIRFEAEGIASYEFRSVDGASLTPFKPGSHVDVHLPNGLVRSYSLSNDSSETHRYVVTVARDPNSRGGSACMHDQLRVGQTLPVSAPANHFELDEGQHDSLLIAGGVGVTPVWCMAQRLHKLGRPFKVVYAARSRRNAAFANELEKLASETASVHLHFDDQQGLLDISETVRRSAAARTHVYCCGPVPMLAAFESACEALNPDHVHVEYFKAKEVPVTADGVELVLAKSKKTIQVGDGMTILDAVLAAGIDIPYSCMEGICGSCEAGVLEGEPDHHDSVLSDKQKRENKVMLICCSGAKSKRLVLDL